METTFVYPGCYAPPTYGHFEIANAAAEIFPAVTIVCSTNEAKNDTRWFSEDECAQMWKAYDLPKNVTVRTFQHHSEKKPNLSALVMIRGIRDENDMENEKRVMKLNKEKFGINKIFYILADDQFRNISSSKARQAALDLDFQTLATCVAPQIVTALLEKALGIKNLFMAVGKPGCGKSTFLRTVSEVNDTFVHINTDDYSQAIRPIIEQHFGKDVDIIKLATDHDDQLTKIIAPAWFQLLKNSLLQVPKESNVLLEIPYGLRHGKDLFRFVGNKIIYIGCEDEKVNLERIKDRGTEKHARFISKIPNLFESHEIARTNRLSICSVNTSGSITGLRQKAESFVKQVLNSGKE